MVKRLLKSLNLKFNPFATVSAAELAESRPLVRSNVPGPYLMNGVTDTFLRMNNSEYSEKMFRKENNLRNEMDILEDEVLDNVRSIIYDYYNHPYKIIPVINDENSKYRENIIKLNSLINGFVKKEDLHPIQLVNNDKYKQYKPSGLSLTSRHYGKVLVLIEVLEKKGEKLKEILEYEIYSDVYAKLVSVNKMISNILILDDSRIEERIDFYNDHLDRRSKY